MLSICKFLDTALVLRKDDLELHRWIFITESLEVIGSREGVVFPLVDRMARSSNAKTQESAESLWKRGYLGHSIPLLNMKRITEIRELNHFFEFLSWHLYFSTLDPEPVSIQAIEEILKNDFLE